MAKPFVKSPQVALGWGILLSVAGSLLLWDAYDRRGNTRPFALRFLPGP